MNTDKEIIENAWKACESQEEVSKERLIPALKTIFQKMNKGTISVVVRPTNKDEQWHVNQWVKKAILLAFRLFPSERQGSFPLWWDKIPLWQGEEETLLEKKIRIAPGSFVRQGCYIGSNVVIMPSSINIGAWIDQGSMIDYGACIGSCAFVGKKCHISASATVGGVLEPLQSYPVIIEDNVFVGAGCHILEGVRIGRGSILSAGVVLTSSTKIIDRNTGHTTQGYIPDHSVVVPGAYTTGDHGLSIQCAIIIKKTSDDTKKKTAINTLLRQ